MPAHASYRATRPLGAAASAMVIGAVAVACGASEADRTFDDTSPSDPASGNVGGASGGLGDPGAGLDGKACAARITTAARAEVDVIVVIDTSGSMQDETNQVKANLNAFASKIGSTGLDYTVVMIAEKPLGFPFPGVVLPGICVPPPLGGPDCTDKPPTYHQVAEKVGSTGSLKIILAKLSTYEPWLRPSAFKVFIEVTDDNTPTLTAAQFDQQLLAASPAQFGTAASRKYIFNSICGWTRGTPHLSTAACATAANTGEQYQMLSQLTGGTIDSVCESDYSSVFDNIAKGLVKRLGCEFALPKSENGQPIDPTRVAVEYTPGGGSKRPLTQVTDVQKCASIEDGWYYDDNAKPAKILFCPSTCSGPGSDTSGKLEVAVGCLAPAPR